MVRPKKVLDRVPCDRELSVGSDRIPSNDLLVPHLIGQGGDDPGFVLFSFVHAPHAAGVQAEQHAECLCFPLGVASLLRKATAQGSADERYRDHPLLAVVDLPVMLINRDQHDCAEEIATTTFSDGFFQIVKQFENMVLVPVVVALVPRNREAALVE